MGFSIDYGSGLIEALVIIVLVSAALIVAVFFLAGVRRARRDALDLDPDHKGPEF